jgi:hypothetical protein
MQTAEKRVVRIIYPEDEIEANPQVKVGFCLIDSNTGLEGWS